MKDDTNRPASIRPVATYSIIARDQQTGHFGIAVQSHWFSVGAVVPWAEAGVGAVATQSLVDVRYGPMGLALMKGGRSASEALRALVASDDGERYRQVAMLDSEGQTATHTGSKCIAEASHTAGVAPDGSAYSCQANMMASPGVPESMARAFESTQGDLSTRMMAALKAAQRAGGDIRGKQSAAMLIVKGESTGRPWADRVLDIRVEDHPEPLVELDRLLTLHRAYDLMNEGDVAMEKGETHSALESYSRAMALVPDHAEMVFWTAVSLVNAGELEKALPLFARAYQDSANWRELARRLPDSDLLPDDPKILDRILDAN